MSTLTVYQTDDEGIYLYETQAYSFALDPDNFNIPYRAVTVKVPAIPEGQRARWTGKKPGSAQEFTAGKWLLEDIPRPPAQEDADAQSTTAEASQPGQASTTETI
jgi:hypothetical protein